MHYTIMEQEFVKFENNRTIVRVAILADTAADVPQPKSIWDAGSICIIASDHSCKLLNTEGEWV